MANKRASCWNCGDGGRGWRGNSAFVLSRFAAEGGRRRPQVNETRFSLIESKLREKGAASSLPEIFPRKSLKLRWRSVTAPPVAADLLACGTREPSTVTFYRRHCVIRRISRNFWHNGGQNKLPRINESNFDNEISC